MSRLIKAIANRQVFANRKSRVAIKAKSSAHTTLHAQLVTAFYSLCESLRGLLGADATAWQTDPSTQPWCSWMSGMQPCVVVRHGSPRVVVVA
jgi:hypothetical protein